MNLYGFVGNDPINYNDPFGLWPSCSPSQEEWDKINRMYGEPDKELDLDDWEDRILKSGVKGSFVTPGQAARGAEDATEVGVTAATGMALPQMNSVRILTTGHKLRQLKALEEVGDAVREKRAIQELNLIGASKQPLLLPGVRSAEVLRNTPGLATARDLPIIREGQQWLRGTGADAGRVPGQIAKCLSGRSFNNWREFREEFWKAVADDPVLSRQFNPGNLREMQAGRAPFALASEQVGKRVKYEIDHMLDIQYGGGVYDMNNLIIRTPVNHIGK